MSRDAGLAEGVLTPLARLLAAMAAAGVPDPARTVRDALRAGEDAVKYPLLAWGDGVDPAAIAWAPDIQVVVVTADVLDDEQATQRAVALALDVAALARWLEADES